jgi:hypothetical protein
MMMHGPTATVSAASNSGSAAPTSLLQRHPHRPSRSNSLSSSSVVTIKRTGSFSSSSTGARTSTAPMRAPSPGDPSLIALRLGRDHMSHDHKRRKSVAVEPSGSQGEGEGLNNLNRWSHSTNSSVTSLPNNNARRSRASSGAALQSQFSPQKRSRTGLDQSPRASPQRNQRRLYSPVPGPDGRRRLSRPEVYTNSLTALPPLHTTPSLTDPNDSTESPSTIQTLQTPPTQSAYSHTYAHDYFGEDGESPRSAAKSKKPILIRNHTAPMSSLAQQRPALADGPQEHLRRTHTSEAREPGSRPGTGGESSGHGSGHRRTRTREGREKNKKVMLSKALQKANTAVLLDNAQNFEGALEAYSDACKLLQQVMDRSSGLEDKRKLEAIRVTYTNRIEELRQLEMSRPSTADDKDLPARPMSDDSLSLSLVNTAPSPIDEVLRSSAIIETATATRITEVPKLSYSANDRDSFFSRTMEAVASSGQHVDDSEETPTKVDSFDVAEVEVDAEAGAEREPEIDAKTLHLPPSEQSYVPAPLSPRRPSIPEIRPDVEDDWREEPVYHPPQRDEGVLQRADSNENSVSWLDTIDESGSDCGSSVHSVSQGGLHRKHLRHISGETDPDFNAAFDAAVEAAYDEGFEPDMEARKKRETAYKHAPRESIAVLSDDIREVLSPTNEFHPGSNLDLDEEEEERLLDEITQDYAQGFNFDLSSKSALPRQSDSSGYSRSTWQSSQASVDRTTAATSLSTVEEDTLSGSLSEGTGIILPSVNPIRPTQPPPTAPPLTALPTPPTAGNRSSTVRSRRMSGANTKQLKIETATKPEVRKRASTFHHSPSPRLEDEEKKDALDRDFKFGATLEPTPSDLQHENTLTSPPTLEMRTAVSDTIRPQTAVATMEKRRSLDDQAGELLSPRPNLFRKNKSSVSLREHTVLLASPDVESTPSVITPMSSNFMAYSSRKNQDPLTSQRAKFPSFDAGYSSVLQSGGAYLFDTSLSSLQAPTSPRSPPLDGQPVGLEPCPESIFMRPFWLMRGLASTLTHPKGGFLTTRLFVPREVWHTRGVKLKSLEDKIANCDLLTAALGRLAGVDTYDAEAVMEELQSFEEVMERVQGALAKKLGNEVGLHGVAGLFKDAGGGGLAGATMAQGTESTAVGADKPSKSKEGKGYLNSWRKLRSKSSGTPLSSGQAAAANAKPTEKELPTMPTVPMTSFVPVERRGQKKNLRNMSFEGPQKEYMGSLARLFEGAQVLGKSIHTPANPDRFSIPGVAACLQPGSSAAQPQHSATCTA